MRGTELAKPLSKSTRRKQEDGSVQVTIALPFYNNESTLPAAVNSVFAQTFSDWELILLDDGSTDNSMCISSGLHDSRVKFISNQKNQNLAQSLNQIAWIAEGEYLARMDADDVMHPERIEKQVNFLKSNPLVDIVGTHAYVISGRDEVIGLLSPQETLTPYTIMKGGALIHPTVMGRVKWFQQNQYDRRFNRAQDYELWCRTILHSNYANVAEPLLFYRDTSLSNPSGARKRAAMSYRYVRAAVRQHGPRNVGLWRTIWLLQTYLLKELILWGGTSFGLYSMVIRNRYKYLDPEKISEANRILADISHKARF